MRPFSLAGLLRVRTIQERSAAEDLSRAAVARRQTEAREHHLRNALSAGDSSATDVHTLAALAATRVSSRHQLSDLRLLGQTQDADLAAARARHQSARIEEHGLTKLADAHARSEFDRLLHAEQQELDEIAVRPRPEEPN